MTKTELKRIKELGFMNWAHWEEFKKHSYLGLGISEDQFLRNIGMALAFSDFNNSIKLITVFRQECEKYSILYKMYLAKEKANDQAKD